MREIRDRFLNNVCLIIFSTSVKLILGMATIMIIVRNLSVEEFGVYVLIQVVAYFFVIVTDFGINYSSSKFIVSAKNIEKANWGKSLILIKLVVVVLTSIIIVLFEPIIAIILKRELFLHVFLFIVLIYILQSVESFFNSILQGYYRFKKIAFTDIIVSVTRVILIIILMLFYKKGLQGALIAFVLSLFLSCSIMFPIIILKGKLKVSYLKQIFHYCWPIGVESILGFFDGKVYNLIIMNFLGAIALGFFEVVNKIPEQFYKLFEAFRSVFFPQIADLFSSHQYEKISNFLYHSIRVIGLLSGFAALIAGLFHSEIITFLFSEKYAEASNLFFYLIIISYFYLISYLLWVVLISGGFSFISMNIHIVQIFVGVGTSIILLPKLGLVGIIIGSFLFNIIPFIVTVYLLERRKIFIKKIILVKPLVPFFISWLLYKFFYVDNSVIKLVFIIPFLILAFKMSLVCKDDFGIIKDLISKKNTYFKSIRSEHA